MDKDDANDDYIPVEGFRGRLPPGVTDEDMRRFVEGRAERREAAFKKWINDPKVKEYLDRLRRRTALGE